VVFDSIPKPEALMGVPVAAAITQALVLRAPVPINNCTVLVPDPFETFVTALHEVVALELGLRIINRIAPRRRRHGEQK
jgi:hypothetical protein